MRTEVEIAVILTLTKGQSFEVRSGSPFTQILYSKYLKILNMLLNGKLLTVFPRGKKCFCFNFNGIVSVKFVSHIC